MTLWRFSLSLAVTLSLLIGPVVAQEQPPQSPTEPEEKPEEPTVIRSWTDTKGRSHRGQLLAFDNIHATLQLADNRVVFVPPHSLSAEDQAYLRLWRKDHPKGAWIAPGHVPPWPVRAGTGPVKVVLSESDAANSHYVYHSQHFVITSDVSLPLNTVSDMATAFEATHHAVLQLPLGLGARPILPPPRNGTRFRFYPSVGTPRPVPENAPSAFPNPSAPPRLPVELFITPQAYGLAGGAAGTGGSYSRWRGAMLISLQNFGITIDDNGRIVLDYRNNHFILRHEVTHQLMRHWLPFTPTWLSEGMAEYLAALPFQAGQYDFRDLEKPFIAYLNKWRYEEDPFTIPMLQPSYLLNMKGYEWQAALDIETPVLNYNSAALLTWYFLHQDGEGNAAHLATYFALLRQNPQDAKIILATHLLRGRAPEEIATEIRAAWKKHGVEIVFE